VKEARDVIREKGLPNLAAPRAIVFAREIPKLGTGKVNHRELQSRLAGELAKL
jgi:acyl-[acyl-carrier-protein]-phospholipid O-acyltransferase/long-chain-fatty-acid--[acyl-carrier-protein] ligase